MNVNNISFALLQEKTLLAGGVIFLVSLITGTIFTFLMCRLSWRWGILDRPDGSLKCHQRPTATLGGIPLFISIFLGGMVLWAAQYIEAFEGILENMKAGIIMFGAGLIILVIGAKDDIINVKPRTKILFQVIASLTIIYSGIVIRQCSFFGVFDWSPGALAVPFTIFWLVGSCNAFNFIDGMDGLASGMSLVISLLLAVLGFINGAQEAALLSLAIAGGLTAILIFNVQPALIFLGDSGSQLIGLLLGTLTIKIATVNGVFMLPTAGLILSVPIIDVFLSIIRRYGMSTSPAQGDHHHLHHCLMHQGLNVRQVTTVLWSAVFVTGCAGIMFQFTQGVTAGLAALTLVVLELYLGVRLGCLNIQESLTDLWNNSLRKINAQGEKSKHVAELEALWDRMKPLFEKMQLDRVVLTLEGVSDDDRCQHETYQWVRSEELMADILASQWTKRFSLGGDKPRIATLRLESTDQFQQDEKRIDWLLQQISANMKHLSNRDKEIQKQEKEMVETAG